MRDLSFENQAYRASGLNLLIAIRPETRIRRFSAHVPDITYLKKELGMHLTQPDTTSSG
jgi:hypothetical protein